MMHDWFREAKFGIFIHWGIYAVAGVEASWSFFRHGTPEAAPPASQWLPYEQYMALASGFTAERYDPADWARLFASAGARYAVLTTKHHDGVALWPTEAGPLSIQRIAPGAGFNGDLVGPFCDAMRKEGLRVGLYFSHADWSHPDYASVFKDGESPAPPSAGGPARFTMPKGKADPARWERFLAYHRQQIQELCARYHPDLLWFDGEWERTPRQWRMRELRAMLDARCPGAVLNDRLGGFGDYLTPEQVLPIRAPAVAWEFCTTINHQWGYSPDNSQLKPLHLLTWMLMQTVGLGGNLLLNIGPRPDGTFDPEQRQRLEELGAWIRRNEEAIFDTAAGLPPGHAPGPSTLSADRRTLYVCLFDRPSQAFPVRGIRNRVRRIRPLSPPPPAGAAGAVELAHRVIGGAPWANIPGDLWIDSPAVFEAGGTVLAIELEGPLDLWDGST